VTDSVLEPAHVVTRRTALGAGLAFASVALVSAACPAGFGAQVARRSATRPIDALLVDETIVLPGPMAWFIEDSRHEVSVVGVSLDAAAHGGLQRVLGASHAIVGVSCGATLFCLERIAWDHGFRLAGRSARSTAEPGTEALQRDVAAFLGGAHLPAACSSPTVRAYRPSRIDGVLHAWIMHKNAREA